MSQRVVTLISVGLTAFVLVVGGAVAGRITQPVESKDDSIAEPSAISETSYSPEVKVFMDREAEYRSLIRQANGRLQKAYAQRRINAAFTSSEIAFSIDQATEIALQSVPGAILLRPAELVNFQGVMAYEIALDSGMVYVDASTGQIIYNSAVNDPSLDAAVDKPDDARDPGLDSGRDKGSQSGDRQGESEREDEHEDEREHEDGHEDEHEGQEHEDTGG